MVRLACLLVLCASPGFAQLLSDGRDRREIPFVVVDGKPMLEVTVNGQPGQMMLDNGTPETVMLNREAADLAPGQEVARGNAASGQPIIVMLHDAPVLAVDGQAMELPAKVVSGDFGFVEAGFGAGFMGFLGSPFVEPHPFLLDYARKRLVVLRAGTFALSPQDVRGEIVFSYWKGEQPTAAVRIGEEAMLVDFDTGDNGTLYLRPATQAALARAGLLTGGPDLWKLKSIRLGDMEFGPLTVTLVQAGGPKDFRRSGPADFLRLGAIFLADTPTLWDFPRNRLIFLAPAAALFADPALPD
ncbi:hypothetical protein [Tabrizicola sp.]|uniref:hypothetical protein n=1 Tax=Tabrizicola sp. TaxID=2005166 RepID=UPI0027376A63|nr:hypothetical protein [Tabrizicola sp.]MDP3197372.1 hypothetical protein [Tabrizicola sp.]MDZ4066347.1 hypothetical protein [Tabrizicola sp.]